MCINWGMIFLGIFIANMFQLVFEASMLYSLEITFNPTPLEKYRSRQLGEELNDDDDDNPDGKRELDCEKVTNKCLAEMAFIGSYLFIIISFIVGITYSIIYGRPKTIMVEFFIAWAIDQGKSIPVQLFLYFVVVLRLNFYKNYDMTVWNDQEIAERGPDPSLMQKMRSTIREFLERQKIADFILGMVILLCVVIFSELALAQQIE